MAEEHGILREIAWREIFPWLSLVRTVRLALAPRMLCLAVIGLVLTAIGWRILGTIFPNSSALLAQPTSGASADELLVGMGELRQVDANPTWPWQTQANNMSRLALDRVYSYPLLRPLTISGEYLTRPFRGLFRRDIGATGFLYCLLCSLWGLAVWSVIGGAITRIAALELARESRLGFVGGLRFGITKWPAYFFGPLVPLLGVVVLIILGFIVGLFMRWDFPAVVVAAGWPLMLAICFGIAILVLGLAFGWPLMWPTIGAEGTDSFDAISRSYSYLFQRPLQYLFYALIAGSLGLLAGSVVTLIADLTIKLGFWAVSWGTGLERAEELFRAALSPDQQTGLLSTTGYLLAFWSRCVMLVATAFLYSYFWTAATGIYFLLRQNLDGMEPEEVAMGEPEEDPSYGLPPLAADELGVPRVVDPPAATSPSSPSSSTPEKPAGPPSA